MKELKAYGMHVPILQLWMIDSDFYLNKPFPLAYK